METLDIVQAVQRMQDYITKNIHEPITISDLSRVSNYFKWHSARIFKELTGYAPFEYIRQYRLTQGARRLRDEGAKVIDVAIDFVFDSHEGFTRAFSKEFGISPFAYKTKPIPVKYFIPYSVLEYYLIKSKGESRMERKEKQIIFTQVIERPKRKMIIKRGIKAEHYFDYCEEVSCDVWGILESIKEASYEPAGFWLPKSLITIGTSKYVQGVEVPYDHQGVIPAGFEIIELEACKMMVFQGESYNDENFMEAIDEVWDAIDKFNL